VLSVLDNLKLDTIHRRLNHKPIKALLEARRLRKLNFPADRSVFAKSWDARKHVCDGCARGRPRRRIYHRRRDLDDEDPRMPKPFERGHMVVSDSHEFTNEPDLSGNIIRFNFTDAASGDVWSYPAKSHEGFDDILKRFYHDVVNGPEGFRWLRFILILQRVTSRTLLEPYLQSGVSSKQVLPETKSK
jgi:hypothetical protein